MDLLLDRPTRIPPRLVLVFSNLKLREFLFPFGHLSVMNVLLMLLAATLASAYEVNTMELRPNPGNRLALEVQKTGLLRGKTHVFVFGKYRGAVEYNDQNP